VLPQPRAGYSRCENPTPTFARGGLQGQDSLAGCRDCRGLDTSVSSTNHSSGQAGQAPRGRREFRLGLDSGNHRCRCSSRTTADARVADEPFGPSHGSRPTDDVGATSRVPCHRIAGPFVQRYPAQQVAAAPRVIVQSSKIVFYQQFPGGIDGRGNIDDFRALILLRISRKGGLGGYVGTVSILRHAGPRTWCSTFIIHGSDYPRHIVGRAEYLIELYRGYGSTFLPRPVLRTLRVPPTSPSNVAVVPRILSEGRVSRPRQPYGQSIHSVCRHHGNRKSHRVAQLKPGPIRGLRRPSRVALSSPTGGTQRDTIHRWLPE